MGLFHESDQYDQGDSANAEHNPELRNRESEQTDPFSDPWRSSFLSPYSESPFGDLDGTGHYEQDPNRFDPEIRRNHEPNGMAKAALLCGICSLLGIIFGTSIFLGGLGIIFALLSRRRKLSPMASVALALNAAGILLSAAVIAVSAVTLVTTGVWDYAVKEAQVTDFSDADSVSEFETNVENRLYNALTGQSDGSADSSSESSSSSDNAAIGADSSSESAGPSEGSADSSSEGSSSSGASSDGTLSSGLGGLSGDAGIV